MDKAQAIATWADTVANSKPARTNKDAAKGKPAYKRSNAERIVSVLRMWADHRPQTAIAQELGISQPSVSAIIAKYGRNTTKDARQILEARAADMALNIVRNGRPADQVQVLKGFRVIPEDADRQAGLNITINGFALVGLGLTQNSPSEGQLPIVDVQALSPPLSEDMHRLTDDSTGAKGNIMPLIRPEDSALEQGQSTPAELANPGAGIDGGPATPGKG